MAFKPKCHKCGHYHESAKPCAPPGRQPGQEVVPEILLGPPGTGKTTSLLAIVMEELKAGVEPEKIAYVSFTRKAAHEAAERAKEQFKLPPARFRWFRTLHSLSFRVLGLSSGEVFQGAHVREFGNWIGIRMTGLFQTDEGTTAGQEKGDRILFMENLSRIRGVTLREQYDYEDDNLSWHEVDHVARGLAKYKTANNLVDYTDMLMRFCDQDWTPDLDVVIVDEAQDLSPLQWRVVWKLASKARRVVIAGDDDQAIYKWAGAAVDYFIELKGRARVLGQSYRVPRMVQRVADRQINRVHNRREKEWSPRAEEGVVTQLKLKDVDWTDKDILVLARNIVYLKDVEKRLRNAGMMYEFKNSPSIPDKLRRAIYTWDRLTRKGQPQSVHAVCEAYEFMESGKGVARGYKQLTAFGRDHMVDVDTLKKEGGLLTTAIWHEAFTRVPATEIEYIRACLRRGEKISERARIRLSTIHGAKGGEADHVVLLTDMAPRTWEEAIKRPDDEARVWYVGVTRARQRLTVVDPTGPRHWRIYGG